MNSPSPGSSTSEVEITHVSRRGLWLLVRDEELLLAYEDFPWFLDQPLKALFDVQEVSPGHLHWPTLDVDLTLEMIRHPERFPLKAPSSASPP